MSTYRERREARAERLRDWAESRDRKSADASKASHDATAQIPFGQPILVGHHSERGHRRALDRSWDKLMEAGEHANKAESMRSRADEIERQADRAIYDDDPDAIERLQSKLAGLERRRDAMKAANAAYRKEHRDELKAMSGYDRHHAVPHVAYELSNLGGNISRTRDRLRRLERERERGPRDRIITARYDGTCADCGAPLKRGDQIRYSRANGARCQECES